MSENLMIVNFRIFFLHIPKAAGTTFYELIYQNYRPREIVKIDGTTPEDSMQRMAAWTPGRKRHIRAVLGHMFFGFHMEFPGHYKYITFLRRPFDRVISLYRHLMTEPAHPLHKEAKGQNLSLKEFVEKPFFSQVVNDQTRRIAGIQRDQVTEHDFEAAKQHLEDHFVFVGLAEKFDESILVLRQKLSLGRVFYTRQNVRRGQILSRDELETCRSLIEESNRFDWLLYRYAERLFEKHVSEYDGCLKRDTNQFKNENRRYQQKLLRFPILTLFSKWLRVRSLKATGQFNP